MGFKLGDKIIKISQNPRKSFKKKLQDWTDRTWLFSQSYSKKNFGLFIKEFQKYNPFFLRSYPDPIQFISIMLEKDMMVTLQI